jgi:hypothetical protein
MNLEKAQRKRAKIKMGLMGCSGSGKTYSALLLAFGLCNDWNKVAVIDTENHSADLYDNLGPFNVLSLAPPFTPEKYIEAVRICEKAEMEVIILDSTSHEWDGVGGILDIHGSMTGNSFTNWNFVTPRHNAFVQSMLQCSLHVIATIRTKQDYVLVDKNGKQVPEKVGLKGIQRDGLEYDFTLVFNLDIKNNAAATKDRTGLFFGKPEQKLSSKQGALIQKWCESGSEVSVDDVSLKIKGTQSLPALLQIYHLFPQFQEALQQEYEQQKRVILLKNQTLLPNPLTFSTNGTNIN